jgi:hypothetical protein
MTFGFFELLLEFLNLPLNLELLQIGGELLHMGVL